MQVQLFKKQSKYVDKDGVERSATRFYAQCGETLVPIEVTYFKDKETGKDSQYAGRREVMKAFADNLPEKAN